MTARFDPRLNKNAHAFIIYIRQVPSSSRRASIPSSRRPNRRGKLFVAVEDAGSTEAVASLAGGATRRGREPDLARQGPSSRGDCDLSVTRNETQLSAVDNSSSATRAPVKTSRAIGWMDAHLL